MLKDLGFDIYYIDELNRKLLPLTEKSILQKGILYCKKGKEKSVIDVAVLTIPSFMGTSMTFRYDMGYYEQ